MAGDFQKSHKTLIQLPHSPEHVPDLLLTKISATDWLIYISIITNPECALESGLAD